MSNRAMGLWAEQLDQSRGLTPPVIEPGIGNTTDLIETILHTVL